MDNLNDDPQKVAEDIIKQAKSGFQQEATNRIIQILNCYQQLQQEIKSKVEELTTTELSEIEVKILILISSCNESLSAEQIARGLCLNLTKIEYYLGRMYDQYVYSAHFVGSPSLYSLTQKGRAYLVENDHVK